MCCGCVNGTVRGGLTQVHRAKARTKGSFRVRVRGRGRVWGRGKGRVAV